MTTPNRTARADLATNEVRYDGRDLEILATMERYHRWILENFFPFVHGRAVEYGAGAGTFSRLLMPHVEQLDVVEPSPPLAEALSDYFNSIGHVRVHAVPLERHIKMLANASVDTIMLINVLEHIEDDANALASCARALKVGGHLLLFVPALKWLFSALDRRYGHYRRYDRRQLARMVSAVGFKIVMARYMDILGVAPWWLLNTLGGKTEFDPQLVRLYDRFGIPLTRAIESLVSPPFGKNIILVARRIAI